MAKDYFVFEPGIPVRRPYGITPWNTPQSEGNLTWIEMKARKIKDQSTSGRGGTLAAGEEGATFIFLGPKTIGENIGHTWNNYESMASRLAAKVKDAAKLGSEIGSLMNGSIDTKAVTNVFKGSSANFAAAAENLTRTAYNSVAGHNIPKIKIDTPLYYEGSERRQIVLEFDLIAESADTVKRDVLDVVQDLMRYSSPGMSGRSSIDIEFPYYFEVKTVPGDGIKYTTAALIAVQPTWGEPWIRGYPSHCKLSLTFKDISPLFRKTITKGSIINIVGSTRTRESEAAGELTANKAQAASSKSITEQQKQDSASNAGIQRNRRGGDLGGGRDTR